MCVLCLSQASVFAENADEIKAELQAKGVKFKSQTDTEVIAQLIGASLDEGLDFMPAVKKALGKLEGTWGLAIIHKDKPGEIIAVCLVLVDVVAFRRCL